MNVMPQEQSAPEREFYREQLRSAFQHTGFFVKQTGRAAQDVVDRPESDAVLKESPAGSLDAARRIGEMAVVYLDTVPNQPGPWWRDLTNYERATFLQLATTDAGPPTNRPRRGTSALCATFNWNMPELLKRLKAGDAITDEVRRKTTLLFARTPDGQVRMVEVGAVIEKVFRMTNGLRTVEQIASAAEIPMDQTQQTLASLAGIGAVILGKSAEEMIDILRKQGRA